VTAGANGADPSSTIATTTTTTTVTDKDDDTTISKVDVEWVAGNRFVGSDEEGHSIVFDSLSGVTRRRRRGIGPMDALLTSLGACSGVDVASILVKRKQKPSSLKVEVSGNRERFGYPKPFTEIHLKFLIGGTALEEKYVKEAVTDSVTKYCSAIATVSEKAKVTFSYEIAMA
jgi:putative redox protein